MRGLVSDDTFDPLVQTVSDLDLDELPIRYTTHAARLFLARHFGIVLTAKQFRQMREQGVGPPSLNCGKSTYDYPAEDLVAWGSLNCRV